MEISKKCLAAAVAAILLATVCLGALAEARHEPVAEAVDAMPDELDGVDLMAPEIHADSQTTPGPTPKPEVTLTPEPETAPTPTAIPWYTSAGYPADKTDFEDEIWAVLTGSWGLTDTQAAGLMGNLRAESGFCPYNAQGGGADDRGRYAFRADDAVGFGLCQWTSRGRKSDLLRYAVSKGSEALVWDFTTQMEFIRLEMDLDAIRATDSLYETTEWVALWHERPNQRYANSWPGVRYEYARAIYREHKGRRYREPKLHFSARFEGEQATGDPGISLTGSTAGTCWTLTVNSNYYWRLTRADIRPENWMTVSSPALYHPDRMETCACGYACEGDKILTLSLMCDLRPGERRTTVLRFEIYRGTHAFREIPVTITCPLRQGIKPARLQDRMWAEEK